MPSDYMMRPEELEKFARLAAFKGQPDTGAGALPLLSDMFSGNDQAFAAAWSFWNFSNAFDDLLDQAVPGPVLGEPKEEAMRALHDIVVATLFRQKKQAATIAFAAIWSCLLGKSGWETERKALAEKARRDFFTDMASNPFIGKHAAEFRAMFVQAMFRCLDGDAMAASNDPERRKLAPAVRCGDLEVIFHMIYLARGWDTARHWSAQRDYDVDDEAVSAGREAT